MNRRLVVVAAGATADPLALAMLEDVVDLVHEMRHVEAVLAVPPDAAAQAGEASWPDMAVVVLADDSVVGMLDAAGELGAAEATVVCPDAPDLPALLLGKLHSALTAAEVAVCPADDGTLVALAATLPAAGWLRDAAPRLDDVAALSGLRALAPPRRLVIGAGWHRVRGRDDLHRLDRGLEGWEATRALLDVP